MSIDNLVRKFSYSLAGIALAANLACSYSKGQNGIQSGSDVQEVLTVEDLRQVFGMPADRERLLQYVTKTRPYMASLNEHQLRDLQNNPELHKTYIEDYVKMMQQEMEAIYNDPVRSKELNEAMQEGYRNLTEQEE